MNRLASALSLALVFSLVSCGDDDKPKTDGGAGAGGSTGGSGGSTGGAGGGAGGMGGSTACTGSFAGLTQAQLMGAIAASSGDKKCASAADVALLCTANIATIAGQCGVGCASGPQAMFKTCTSSCITMMVKLSEGCAGCYVDTVACTQQNCLNQCIANPMAPACTACQREKGCRGEFEKCTGIPGPAGDGGAPDSGGTTGDGGVVDAAAPGDGGTMADTAVTADTAATD